MTSLSPIAPKINQSQTRTLLDQAISDLRDNFTRLKKMAKRGGEGKNLDRKAIEGLCQASTSQKITALLKQGSGGKLQGLFDYLNKLIQLSSHEDLQESDIEEEVANANRDLVHSLSVARKAPDYDLAEELVQSIKLCASYRIDKNIEASLSSDLTEYEQGIEKIKTYTRLGAQPYYEHGRQVMPLVNFELMKTRFCEVDRQQQDEITKLLVDIVNNSLDHELTDGIEDHDTDFAGTISLLNTLQGLYPEGIQGTYFETMIDQDQIPEKILTRLEEEFDNYSVSGDPHGFITVGSLSQLPDLDYLTTLAEFGFNFNQVDSETGASTLQRFFALPYQYLSPDQHTHTPGLVLAANDPTGDFRKILEVIKTKDPEILSHKDNEGRNLLVTVIENLEKFYPVAHGKVSIVTSILESKSQERIQNIINKNLPLLKYMIEDLGMTIPENYDAACYSHLVKKLLDFGIVKRG